LIQFQLNNVRRPPDTKIQGAPLLVLEGADMPAVAIEIGNLSNPNEEKALGDTEFLAVIARAIAKGIDTFFAQKAK
jgi:N-acetylmuramoyl-L-alanine amidase